MSFADSESVELSSNSGAGASFDDLTASRRRWIDEVLHPWCLQASQKQLRQAEAEWHDLAGRVDVNATLWTWAWERFPCLTHPEMAGVNETYPVSVTLQDGSVVAGFPDSRASVRGDLVLVPTGTGEMPTTDPLQWSIDEIVTVERVDESMQETESDYEYEARQPD